MEKEIRIIPSEVSEVRADVSRKIDGYGIVFNSESKDLGGFREIILPEAMDGVIERSDILALLNHNVDKGVLARSTNGKGTLNLENDMRGVRYSFAAPNTSLGDEVVEGIKRGDIRTSSFAFSIAKKEDAPFEKQPDGSYIRTIKKFDKIFDISPVYREAYEDTSVALRSLEESKLSETVAFDENTTTTTEIKEERIEEPTEEEIRTEVEPKAEEPAIEPTAEEEKEPKEEKRSKSINNLKHESMTLTELRDLRAKAVEENDKIYELKNAEKRNMLPEEEEIVAENNQKIKEYDFQIETEKRKSGDGNYVGGPHIMRKDKEKFSLMKAILARAEMREMPGVARDLFIQGKENMSRCGVDYTGDIVIPYEIERRGNNDPLSAVTATGGGEVIGTDKLQIIPPLLSKLIFSKAGVTWMSGLKGNVSMPSYSGTSVLWKLETAAADEGTGTTAEVEMTPKRLTGYIDVSKQFLIQESAGAERLLLSNIAEAVARKLESTVLGVAAGTLTQPQGMGYKITTGTDTQLAKAAPTQAILVAMESAVDASNALQENLAYITNAAGRGILKSHLRTATYGEVFLCENNMVNGYPLLVTNSCSGVAGTNSGELLVFGNWKDLVIGQWGGYDITVDPYTRATTGQVRITINAYFDAKGMRGSASTDVHADGTDNDDYAVSFASRALNIT